MVRGLLAGATQAWRHAQPLATSASRDSAKEGSSIRSGWLPWNRRNCARQGPSVNGWAAHLGALGAGDESLANLTLLKDGRCLDVVPFLLQERVDGPAYGRTVMGPRLEPRAKATAGQPGTAAANLAELDSFLNIKRARPVLSLIHI